MPFLSIDFSLSKATAKSTAPPPRADSTLANHASLLFSESCFDSFTPGKSLRKFFLASAGISFGSHSRKTPTATGPAIGPRPTSSMPMRYFMELYLYFIMTGFDYTAWFGLVDFIHPLQASPVFLHF